MKSKPSPFIRKKGEIHMTIIFDTFKFHNDNSVAVHIGLEAPIGTTIVDVDVNPNSDATFQKFSVENIASLKLTVVAPSHGNYTDTETIDFSNDATPYPVYVTAFTAHSGIGSIAGEVSLAFRPARG
jgi:hypothetical protein